MKRYLMSDRVAVVVLSAVFGLAVDAWSKDADTFAALFIIFWSVGVSLRFPFRWKGGDE
jgi:hypothetical protein